MEEAASMKLKHSILGLLLLFTLVPPGIFGIFSIYETNRKIDELTEQNVQAISENQVMNIKNFTQDRNDFQKKWDAIDHEKNPSGYVRYRYHRQDYITYYSDVENTGWGIRVTENLSAQKQTGIITNTRSMELNRFFIVPPSKWAERGPMRFSHHLLLLENQMYYLRKPQEKRQSKCVSN